MRRNEYHGWVTQTNRGSTMKRPATLADVIICLVLFLTFVLPVLGFIWCVAVLFLKR